MPATAGGPAGERDRILACVDKEGIPSRGWQKKVEGPAQDAGPHPRWITEGLKQQKLSPSGEDEEPPDRVSDPAGWTERERIWEPVPPPQPLGPA